MVYCDYKIIYKNTFKYSKIIYNEKYIKSHFRWVCTGHLSVTPFETQLINYKVLQFECYRRDYNFNMTNLVLRLC